MQAEIYWLAVPGPGRLAIMPRPRGGDWLADEAAALHAGGVQVLVSLLTPPEVRELDLEAEEAACRAVGIQVLSFPIADRGVPPSPEVTRE